MTTFPDEPSVSKTADQKWWRPTRWLLNENYQVTLHTGTPLTIPFGFPFETSIPRLLWPLIGPTGTLWIAGLVHDYGYRYNPGNHSRAFWDDIFYRIAEKKKHRPFAHNVAWFGVSIGGWFAWKKHRRNDKCPGLNG